MSLSPANEAKATLTPNDRDAVDAYMRGVESGTMTKATPNVVRHLCSLVNDLDTALRAQAERCAQLEEANETLRTTIRCIEWNGPGFTCVACSRSRRRGHEPGCQIVAALKVRVEDQHE